MRKIYTLLHIVCFFFIQTNTAQLTEASTSIVESKTQLEAIELELVELLRNKVFKKKQFIKHNL